MAGQHGGNVWIAGGGGELAPGKVVDFSANINPLGPPPGVLSLLRKKTGYVRFYPEPHALTFRAACAEKLDVNPGQVIAGNGASELISLFFWTVRPRRVLIPAPAYSDYARAARAAGSRVDFFPPREGFAYPLELLAREVLRSRCDALVFGNPNNPTGAFWEDVTPLIEAAAEKGIPFLLDASFFPFTGLDWPNWQKKNFFPLFWESGDGRKGFHLFVVISLTKIFALPGLRLGIGIGPPALIERLAAAQDPWSVNVFAQLAGLACLDEKDYTAKAIALVEKEREYLRRGLQKIAGLRVFSSRANFLLAEGRHAGVSGAELAGALAKRGLLIRDAGNFKGLDEFYFRLAVRKRAENRRLLKALKEVILEKRR